MTRILLAMAMILAVVVGSVMFEYGKRAGRNEAFRAATADVAALEAAQPQTLRWGPQTGTYAILPKLASDGDTIRFYWLVEDSGRLKGINTPELRGPNAEKARKAREFLASRLTLNKPMSATISGREKYGRALIVLWDAETGKSVNAMLVDEGLADRYMED